MRSAQILGQARPDVMARLDAAVAQSIAGKDIDATLGDIDGMVTLIETIPSPFGDGGQAQLYATRWIGPHTDEVPGDYTVGVILEGDHYLFTGSGRRVGELERGSVFFLNNKKLHGACARDKSRMNPRTTLLFVARDCVEKEKALALASSIIE